jgi:hypothetical protein
MDRRLRDTSIDATTIRVLIIAAALAAMLVIGLDLSVRLRSPGHRFAEAMLLGYQRAMLADADAIER